MKIIPAIDLYANQCVRLSQGKFQSITQYPIDPIACAQDFYARGARELHIVDLEGAEVGTTTHYELIAAIKAATPLVIQCGGGLRSEQSIVSVLQGQLDRVVIGSLAVSQPQLVKSLIQQYGADRFVLAFDVSSATHYPIAIKGWREQTAISLWQMLDHYADKPELRILCTDISRDGMLIGANTELYTQCVQRYPQLRFQASGGVGQLEDVDSLKRTGVDAAIIGKALYEGRIALEHLQLDENCNNVS